MVDPPSSAQPGSKDGQMGPVSDNDVPYKWGHRLLDTTNNLAWWQIARLMVLRGKLQDQRIDRHIQAPDPDGLDLGQ